MTIITFPLRSNKLPAVPKDTSWKDYKGEVNTPMFGAMIPKGVFIIDLDLYKGVSYEDVDAVLKSKVDWDTSLLQETKSGGVHHAFSVPADSNLINGTDVLIKNLDTRSALKGYIATGEGYTSKTDDGVIGSMEMSDFVFPELPTDVLAQFTKGGDVVNEFDSLGDLATIVANDNTLDLTLDEIKDYLECLPIECCDEDWLNVVMAVYHETHGSEEGYTLIDEWSKKCPDKYDEETNRSRWDSSHNDSNENPITFKSVIKLAGGKQATRGIELKRIEMRIEESTGRTDLDNILPDIAAINMSTVDLSSITGLLQAKYQEVAKIKISKPDMKKAIKKSRVTYSENTGFVEDYIFCATSGLYLNKNNMVAISRHSFNTKHNRHTALTDNGEPQQASSFADHTIEVVDYTMYLPFADERFNRNKIDYYNSYIPVYHEDVEIGSSDVIERILAHAEWLLPDEREREILLSFIAHQIQNTGRLLHWALVLQGKPGDGKSFWGEVMTHLLGDQNVGIVSPDKFGGQFNNWAAGSAVNLIEELKVDSSKSQYDALNIIKPLITNPKIAIEGKGTNSTEAANCTNYFATTNFKDAVPIDEADRRWCVLFTKERDISGFCEQNQNHFPELYDVMRLNIPELFKFFNEYQIPEWFKKLSRAPKTHSRGQMIELSKSESEVLLDMAMEQFQGEHINSEMVNITYLNQKVTDGFNIDLYQDFPKPRILKKILLNRGYCNVKRERIDGEFNRIYTK